MYVHDIQLLKAQQRIRDHHETNFNVTNKAPKQ